MINKTYVKDFLYYSNFKNLNIFVLNPIKIYYLVIFLFLCISCKQNEIDSVELDSSEKFIGKWELVVKHDRFLGDGKYAYKAIQPEEKTSLEFQEDSVINYGYYRYEVQGMQIMTGKYWFDSRYLFTDLGYSHGPWFYQFSRDNDTLLLISDFSIFHPIRDKYVKTND